MDSGSKLNSEPLNSQTVRAALDAFTFLLGAEVLLALALSIWPHMMPDNLRYWSLQIIVFILLLYCLKQGWRPQFGKPLKVLGVSLASCGIYFLILVVGEYIGHSFGFQPPERIRPLAFTALTLLAAPVFEELFFRDLMLRGCLFFFAEKKAGVWIAVSLSALFFTLAHMNFFFVGAFCLGMINGWVYLKSGSVIPGILVHVISNASWFFIPRLFPHLDGWMQAWDLMKIFYQ